MMSYGVALLIIIIAAGIIYKVGVLNPNIAPVYCQPAPGFSCGQFSLNTSGVITLSFSQATGGPIIINGVACSSKANQTTVGPMYGNVHVTKNSAYYPPGAYSSTPLGSITMYSGGTYILYANCYDSAGIASGNIGSAFFGYVWLNYTVPGYGTTTQQVATFVSKYT
ncbi:MAG: hypothetical protein ACP5K9_02405 [Candidatus Micrarchaeia archaeon]